MGDRAGSREMSNQVNGDGCLDQGEKAVECNRKCNWIRCLLLDKYKGNVFSSPNFQYQITRC